MINESLVRIIFPSVNLDVCSYKLNKGRKRHISQLNPDASFLLPSKAKLLPKPLSNRCLIDM